MEKWVWSEVYTRSPSSARPLGGPSSPPEPRDVDVAHERHRDEVGHDPAGGQDPEGLRAALVAIADEVAQPANDLLLHEGPDRAGVPDVDALLRDLREDLAGHGGEQWRRGEVAERARVVGAHGVRRDPCPRTPGARSDSSLGVRGAGARGCAGPEELPPECVVPDRRAHCPDEGMVVEVLERRLPDHRAGRPQRLPRCSLVANVEISWGSGCQSTAGPAGLDVTSDTRRWYAGR